MFNIGKKPIDVAIELDLPENEVCNTASRVLGVESDSYELLLVYQELKHDFDLFFELFKLLKKNKMLNGRLISKLLRYAGHDLPSLENKMRKLTNDVIELEIRKKELNNTIMLQHTQLSDLGQTIIRYQRCYR